ncbi:clathrin light chain [Spinellus fusiger]|nr:clathrin light chain [Spinellus fusiger]
MSEFGDFGSTNDPTTDFLARERAALGEDADLFSNDAQTSLSDFPEFPSPSVLMSPQQDDRAKSYMSTPLSGTVAGNFPPHTISSPAKTETDYSVFDSEFPKAEELETSHAFHRAMLPEEEPETVRQWKEKQKEVIAARDEEAEKIKQETIRQAREDIDKFYEDYNDKKQKAIEENREREESYQKDREEAATANVWERVSREVDTSASKAQLPTRDVSRMKDLMLDLRKDPKAPGTIVNA